MEENVKLPTAFNILGTWIEVHYKEEVDDGEAYGAYSPSRNRILLEKDQESLPMFRAMLHEIMHSYFDKSANDDHFTQEQQEAVCRLVENFAEIVYLRPKSKKIRYKRV